MALTKIPASMAQGLVNKAGDTMTGPLKIAGSVGNDSNALMASYNGASGNATFGPDSSGGDTRLDIGTSSGGSYGIKMSIDSLGRVTMPYQPAFNVGKNNGNVPAGYVMVFNAAYLNRGNHYSAATGRFTAPVAGAYFFLARVINAAGTSFYGNAFILRKNGAHIVSAHNYTTTAYEENIAGMVIDMAVGDYVDVQASGVECYGVQYDHSNFHGFLIG